MEPPEAAHDGGDRKARAAGCGAAAGAGNIPDKGSTAAGWGSGTAARKPGGWGLFQEVGAVEGRVKKGIGKNCCGFRAFSGCGSHPFRIIDKNPNL